MTHEQYEYQVRTFFCMQDDIFCRKDETFSSIDWNAKGYPVIFGRRRISVIISPTTRPKSMAQNLPTQDY
jgi:hypothetical protein